MADDEDLSSGGEDAGGGGGVGGGGGAKWRNGAAGISDKLRKLPAALFWSSPEVQGWFRSAQLCTLGRWYAEIPLSNVATERIFAIMRSSEGPLRHALAEHSMDEELGAKVNSWIVDGMLARQNELFR